MKLTRIILIASVLLIGYSLAVVASVHPWVALAVFLLLLARKGYRTLSAFGTARWASEKDLRRAGMLDSETGLILGRMVAPCPNVFAALVGLFNPRVKSAFACEQFFGSLRRFNRKRSSREPLVRLSNAVHPMLVAPTALANGAPSLIPTLLTCTDSMAVIDFKGELARLTADRRREMEHRVH